ncbi:unnamed protein product [Trichobilharzia szidati]|nr:unnamed protein product [Trichobilharzia szidati]
MMMKFCALLLIVQAFTIFIKPSEASEDKTKLKTCIEEYCKKTYANCKELCDTNQSKISLKDCVKEANCFGVKHKNINTDKECRRDCVKVKKNCVKNILKNKFIQGA